MRRLSMMVTPATSERTGQQCMVISLIHQVANRLKLCPIVPRDPMSPAICERGADTHSIFGQLVDILTADEANGSPLRVGPHEDGDADEIPGNASPEGARMTSTRTKNRVTAIPASMPLRGTSSGYRAACQDEPELAEEKTTNRLSGMKIAATTSQQASIPGEHEVSPLSEAKGHPNGEAATPLTGSTTPSPWRRARK